MPPQGSRKYYRSIQRFVSRLVRRICTQPASAPNVPSQFHRLEPLEPRVLLSGVGGFEDVDHSGFLTLVKIDDVDTGSIGGRIWHDINGNGLQDEGESGLSERAINLRDAFGNPFESQTPDEDGLYLFSDLEPGTYSLHMYTPAGYQFTDENVGDDDTIDSDLVAGQLLEISIEAGQQLTEFDVGFGGQPRILAVPAGLTDFVERIPSTITGTFEDVDGDLQEHTVQVEWHDGSVSEQVLPAGVNSFSFTRQYAENGSYQATFKVIDEAGYSYERQQTVQVYNNFPSAEIELPLSINEGQPLTVSAVNGFDSAGGELQYMWSLDGNWDSNYVLAGQTVTFDLQALQNAGYSSSAWNFLRLRVIDEDGDISVFGDTVDIINLPPVIEADVDVVIGEQGKTIELFGTVADPENDGVAINASMGTIIRHGDHSWRWVLQEGSGVPAGEYFVTITANDGEGAASSHIFQLKLTENAGGLVNLNEQVIDEGSDLPLSTFGIFDSPADQASITWDLDGDGIFDDAIGESPIVGWQNLVDLGLPSDGSELAISAKHTDNLGFSTVVQDTFRINNLRPILNVADQVIGHNTEVFLIDVSGADVDILNPSISVLNPYLDAYEVIQQIGPLEYLPAWDDRRRQGNKYFRGDKGLYSLGPSGRFRHEVVFGRRSVQIARLNDIFYENPDLLVNAQPVEEVPDAFAGYDRNDGQIVIRPNGFTGRGLVSIGLDDGEYNTTARFFVDVINQLPDLNLDDIDLSHSAGQQRIALPQADADNDPVTHTVSFVNPQQLGFDASQQFGLKRYYEQFDNRFGENEKWILGNGGWYLLFENGDVRQFRGTIDRSEIVANVGEGFFADPQSLIDATDPDPLPADLVEIDPQTGELVFNPLGFMGSAIVTVTADDGIDQVQDTFVLDVRNNAPDVEVADQNLNHNEGVQRIALPAADIDGDALTYNVSFVDPQLLAFNASQQFGLNRYFDQFDNRFGENEKWVLGLGGWYLLFENGDIRKFAGTIDRSEVVANVGENYHPDPQSLIDAQLPGALPQDLVSYDAQTNELVINPVGFMGDALVTLAASDGVQQTSSQFDVSVSNTAPKLELDDVNLSHNAGEQRIALPNVDADGDVLGFTVSYSDPEEAAFEARTDFGFSRHHAPFDGRIAANSKWILGNGGWYLLFDNGEIRQWRGTVAGSPLVAQIDSDYYDNPQALLDAELPDALPQGLVTYDAQTNELVVNPTGFQGNAKVVVTIDDGIEQVQSSFKLTVTNNPPQVDIDDQQVSYTADEHRIALPDSDVDGDALTFQVEYTDVQQVAFDAVQQFGLRRYYEQFDARLGLDAKWFLGNGGWYLLFANGELKKWQGNEANSPTVANLGETFFNDPQAVLDAQQPAQLPQGIVTYDEQTNELVVTPDGFTGELFVDVTVSDGVQQTNSRFKLTIANLAPEVDVPDQAVAADGEPVTIQLPTEDADGEAINYTANVQTPEAIAYQTREDLGLNRYLPQYDNRLNLNERWVLSTNRRIYLLLPTGSILQWSGNVDTSEQVGKIDAAYWQDVDSFLSLLQPDPLQNGTVTIDPVTKLLTIDPTLLPGNVLVELIATDGSQQTSVVFGVELI